MLYLLPLPLLALERQFQCEQISLLYWLRYFLQAHCVCSDNNNDWRLRWKHFLVSPSIYTCICVCVWFRYDIVDLAMVTRFENGSLFNRFKRWFQQCIRIVTINFCSIRITGKVVLSLFCVVCASNLRYCCSRVALIALYCSLCRLQPFTASTSTVNSNR